MAINNKLLGMSGNEVMPSPGEPVLPKLIDHNTTEAAFQEGLDDVARQVDRTQVDIGYDADITVRTNRQARTVDDRLDTVEDLLGVAADNTGTQSATSSTQMIGNTDNASADIAGTLAAPRINPLAVDNMALGNDAVTTDKIMDDTILNGDINAAAGIERTKLETAIQTFAVTTGTNTATAQNLGSDISVPLFAQDQDGVADGPGANEATGSSSTDDLFVLASDNNWYQLNNFVRNGQQVPASAIDYTTTSHTITIPDSVPTATTVETYIALAANRNFGLENGDIVSVTDQRPTPDQTTAYIYIGNTAVDQNTNATAADFVQIGVAQTYGVASVGGLEFEPNTNNFRLTSTIPGARTFSAASTFSMGATFTGTMAANGNVVLGDANTDRVSVNGRVNTNIIPDQNGTRALGSDSLRWDVNADNLNFMSINGTVGNSNFADNTVDPSRLSRLGATAGQVVTVNADEDDVLFMDPPIGVEMGTMLPASADAAGVLFSLTAADGDNPIGIYRAVNTTGTWERLGIVNAIVSKNRFTSTAGTTNYNVGVPITAAHIITVDGLTLVETVGITSSSNIGAFVT